MERRLCRLSKTKAFSAGVIYPPRPSDDFIPERGFAMLPATRLALAAAIIAALAAPPPAGAHAKGTAGAALSGSGTGACPRKWSKMDVVVALATFYDCIGSFCDAMTEEQ
jgi:hypothetical protein